MRAERDVADPGRRSCMSAALAAGCAALCGPGPAAAAPAAIGERVRWPALQLLDGPALSPEHWQDQAVVVVFFSTTCPFCRRHNQHVNRLAAQAAAGPHQVTPGRLMASEPPRGTGHAPSGPGGVLKVLGVAQDQDADKVRRYLERERLRFAVTLDETPMREALSRRRSVPLTCAIDRQGVLRELIPGEMFEDDVLGLVKWARA